MSKAQKEWTYVSTGSIFTSTFFLGMGPSSEIFFSGFRSPFLPVGPSRPASRGSMGPPGAISFF